MVFTYKDESGKIYEFKNFDHVCKNFNIGRDTAKRWVKDGIIRRKRDNVFGKRIKKLKDKVEFLEKRLDYLENYIEAMEKNNQLPDSCKAHFF